MNKKQISIVITLGSGTFGNTVFDTITLTGLRASTVISSLGGNAQGTAQAMIYGLSLDDMSRLTRIGPIGNEIAGKNTITISAGDEGTTLSEVFSGTIMTASAALNQSPDVAFTVLAQSAGVVALTPANPNSFPDGTDISEIFQTLAQEAGLTLENSGVSQIMPHMYLTGSIYDQIKTVAQAGHNFYEVRGNVLAIWPFGAYRTTNVDTLDISPQTGMVGYPEFSEWFVDVKHLFIPQAAMGQQMNITNSIAPGANRSWSVISVQHFLESEMPNGKWFTELKGLQIGV